jgi:hypothetical protein
VVFSSAALYVETNSSGVITAVAVAAGYCVANVWRMRMVSGMRGLRSSGMVPRYKSTDAGVSPLLPIRVASGPEPKGVVWAWWYCSMLILHTAFAMSVGLVTDLQGPFQVFGLFGSPDVSVAALLSGMSIQFKPFVADLFNTLLIFLNIFLNFSLDISFLIAFPLCHV